MRDDFTTPARPASASDITKQLELHSEEVAEQIVVNRDDVAGRELAVEIGRDADPAEDRFTTTDTLRRAAAWMVDQGCSPVEAVMSDNHRAYTSHRFQGLLAELGARHIPTPPYKPRWNGKVERFHRTLNDEWARSQIWPTSRTRDRALASFLRYYNRRRPHTSLGDRPPISRVHKDRGQDICAAS